MQKQNKKKKEKGGHKEIGQVGVKHGWGWEQRRRLGEEEEETGERREERGRKEERKKSV